MATTAGSILGNFAPAMQEPYQIETPLAQDAIRGDPRANSMLNSYWLERQMREGDYASRLADQMAFGRQYLQEQQAETALKAMPDITKNNLLPATRGILTGLLPGLDTTGLDYATQQAANTTQAANIGTAGRGFGAMGQVGLNVPPAMVSQVTGLPGVTQGPSVPERAQAVANIGRETAASIHAAASGGPKYTTQYAPSGDVLSTTVTGKTPPPPGGYGLSVPPAPASLKPSAAAPPVTNQAQPPPPNYSRVTDPAIHQSVANAVASTATPEQKKDIVNGYVGNKPDVFTDGKGNYVVRGKSGTPYQLHQQQNK